MNPRHFSYLACASLACIGSARAQWNPSLAQWGKVDPADVRVMTWNVKDGICSSNNKVEGNTDWCALARIVASLKPDVLLLQECGDNSGNGTGAGIDSQGQLVTTVDLFLHGGTDPFHGGIPVTSYVQLYAPTYDLPYAAVSFDNDGFNRNIILSRFPFSDLNGDTKAIIDDIPPMASDQYAPGGDGGIRGFQFVEIDLPDQTYTGNLVVGGAHLKSGGTAGDHTQRINAAKNVAYVMHHWFNGAGGSVPDPFAKISDVPQATNVLDALTPIVIGGDWNEDELTNGDKGPVEWLTQANVAGGTSDGTDSDGSDMTYDSAVHFFSGSRVTQSSSKLDYLAWQDSVVVLRLASVFLSASNPMGTQPPELTGFPFPSNASSVASDHRTVFADLRLPVVDCNSNGVADTTDLSAGTSYDYNQSGVPDECEGFDGAPYCFGDGIDPIVTAQCPCANFGEAGAGCANSFSSLGGSLTATGTTTPNTLLFTVARIPNNTLTVGFRTTDNLTPGGVQFGDGVRCQTGTLIRFGAHNSGTGGDGPNTWSSAPGSVASGLTRYYQVQYRNSAPAFCPPETFNISNGFRITW